MASIVHFFKSRRGQSLVEMALVLPILLLLVAGAIDLGRAFNHKITITNAAREGARVGSRFPDNETRIREAVEQELQNSAVPYDDEMVEIVILGGGEGDVGGEPIRVTVEYELSTILGSIIDMDTIPMQSSTEMVIFGYDYD